MFGENYNTYIGLPSHMCCSCTEQNAAWESNTSSFIQEMSHI